MTARWFKFARTARGNGCTRANCKSWWSTTTKYFTPEEIASLDAVNKEIFTAEKDDHDELNCPVCGTVRMEHFNYGDTSGIIIAQVRAVWRYLDGQGPIVQKVEEVVDGWKSDLNQDEAKYGPIVEKIEVEEQKELDKTVSISRFGLVNAVLRRFCEYARRLFSDFVMTNEPAHII